MDDDDLQDRFDKDGSDPGYQLMIDKKIAASTVALEETPASHDDYHQPKKRDACLPPHPPT